MKTSPSRNALLGVLGSTAALSALIAAALARGDGNNALAPAAATSVQPSTASPGMVIARDPVTGEMRAPTAEEMAALQPSTNSKAATTKTAPPLRWERLANGAIVTTMDESTTVYSVATVGTDGKVQRACVPAYQLEATLQAAQNGNPISKEARDEK